MIEYNFDDKTKHNNFIVETFNKFSKNKITHMVKIEKNTEYYDFINQHFYCQYESSDNKMTNEYDFIFMSSKNQQSKISHISNLFIIEMKTFYGEYKVNVEFFCIPTLDEMFKTILNRNINSFSEDDIDFTFNQLFKFKVDLSFINNFGKYFYIDYVDMTEEEYIKNKIFPFDFENNYEVKRELIKPDNQNFNYSYILPFLSILRHK